jgi:hypothetical protein
LTKQERSIISKALKDAGFPLTCSAEGCAKFSTHNIPFSSGEVPLCEAHANLANTGYRWAIESLTTIARVDLIHSAYHLMHEPPFPMKSRMGVDYKEANKNVKT